MQMKRFFSEFLATFFLLAIVVGSGVMGERLANGNVAVALLANTLATGAGLVFLILTFGEVSGAHMNPVVSLVGMWRGNLRAKDFFGYAAAQTAGAISGVGAANLMFDLPIFFFSTKSRSGASMLFSEFVATFGLLAVILATTKFRPQITPFAVAAYITSAYWFTASTSFANPAVTIARSLSDTFAGIRPADVLPFIVAQSFGAAAAYFVFRWFLQENSMKKILILCTGNSARSQLAEGLLKHIAKGEYEIHSAGTKPSIVRPEAIKVLEEIGIDISKNRSKSVGEFASEEIDFVLTVCDNAKENCPYFSAKTRLIHHSFEDPATVEGDEKTRLSAFRRVRDELNDYLPEFISEINK